MESEDKGATGAKRMVLGFDAGCLTCSELARGIKEQVGDKLEIRSLKDPQVGEWRKRALGKDAPWAPTLIEVEGFKVRAWTGKRMALALGRSLGPTTTWRVLQVLGEMGAARKIEESPMGGLAGLSPTQFLKGVGGAAVAMSVLSGTGSLASKAFAAQRNEGPKKKEGLKKKPKEEIPRSIEHKEIEGEQRVKTVREIAERPDVKNLLSKDERARLARYDGTDAERSESTGPEKGGPMVAEHKLEYGNSMLAVAVPLGDDRVLAFYEYEKPVRIAQRRTDTKSEAKIWKVEGDKVLLQGASDNGKTASVRHPSGTDEEVKAAAYYYCGYCYYGPLDIYDNYECVSFEFYCLLTACGFTVASSCFIALNPPGCLASIFAFCPAAYFGYCNSYGYVCRSCSQY